jgi:hypothetical protein
MQTKPAAEVFKLALPAPVTLLEEEMKFIFDVHSILDIKIFKWWDLFAVLQ